MTEASEAEGPKLQALMLLSSIGNTRFLFQREGCATAYSLSSGELMWKSSESEKWTKHLPLQSLGPYRRGFGEDPAELEGCSSSCNGVFA